MIQEYPKSVYKSKEDMIIVNAVDEEEKAIEEGYGDYATVVLGRKPDSVVQAEKEAALKEKIEAELAGEKAKLLEEVKVESEKILAEASTKAAEFIKEAKEKATKIIAASKKQ